MSLQSGPRKIEKLSPGCKVLDLEANSSSSMLLLASSDNKLQSHFLKPSIHGGLPSKLIPVKTLDICCIPSLFCFSGNKNIVHCDDCNLIVNNKAQIKMKSKINHLLVDKNEVALTTNYDEIDISSLDKGISNGKLHYYGNTLTSLFWSNSLVISGDEKGIINLWDINQQKIIHTGFFYKESIDHIDSYVDFLHTNVYYSVSKKQRKISFHDLRTYKPIKINSDLSKELSKVTHSQSGKVFLQSKSKIQIIDMYQSFSVMGCFSQLKGGELDDFKLLHPNGQVHERYLNDIMVWDQFLLAGTSIGTVEVYNTDTFQCLYGFGACENLGAKKLKRVGDCLVVMEDKGLVTVTQFN